MTNRFPFFYGWVLVVIGFITLGLVYGMRQSFTVFYVAILEDFRWSRAETAGIFSLNVLVYGITVPVTGILVDRYGPRGIVPIGIALTVAGVIATSQAQALWQFYLFFGAVVAIGTGLSGYVANFTMISNWFVRRRGLAAGIMLAGNGLSFGVATVAQLLILSVGWRWAYIAMATVAALVLLPLTSMFLRRRPQDLGLLPDGDGPAQPAERIREASTHLPAAHRASGGEVVWTVARVLRSGRFWFFFTANLLFWGFGFNIPIAHQVAYIVDQGYPAILGATLVSVYGAVNVAGSNLGFVSDRTGREVAYIAGCACCVLALIALMSAGSPDRAWLLYGYAVLLALGAGIVNPTAGAALADVFHGASFGAINGIIVAGFGVAGALGPWLGGFIFDKLGDYRLAFLLSALAFSGAAVLLWLAAPRRERTQARLGAVVPAAELGAS